LWKLRETSPFKVDKFEDNPNAYALRKEIEKCIQYLYNKRNLLLYGPRGIGKSSLGIQLQKMLMGDKRLLERCNIDCEFPKYLSIRIPCDKEDNLSQIAYNILFYLEEAYNEKFKSIEYKDKKASIKVNFGILQAGIEAKIDSPKYSPTAIATVLTSELSKIIKIITSSGKYYGINVMIDELDYLSPDINFAHFIKNVHEILSQKISKNIFFILAGNTGIYNRLHSADPSISRIVKTIKIPILEATELEYILDYASVNWKPPFKIEDKGKDLIVSLSSGFPHIPHLIGDESFIIMRNELNMTFEDVKIGIENVLKSDKKEQYLDILKNEMTEEERELIIAITRYKSKVDNTLPKKIPIEWIKIEFGEKSKNDISTESILASLVKGGYIKKNSERTHYFFNEELFRIFISLARIEREEALIKREEKIERRKKENIADEQLLNDIISGKLDRDVDLTKEEREKAIKKVHSEIIHSRYTTEWQENEEYNL